MLKIFNIRTISKLVITIIFALVFVSDIQALKIEEHVAGISHEELRYSAAKINEAVESLLFQLQTSGTELTENELNSIVEEYKNRVSKKAREIIHKTGPKNRVAALQAFFSALAKSKTNVNVKIENHVSDTFYSTLKTAIRWTAAAFIICFLTS